MQRMPKLIEPLANDGAAGIDGVTILTCSSEQEEDGTVFVAVVHAGKQRGRPLAWMMAII